MKPKPKCEECRKLKRANAIAVESLQKLAGMGFESAKLALIKIDIAMKGKK